MVKWYRLYKNASLMTKLFAATGIAYIVITLTATVCCYARLDYVRTGVKQNGALQTERAINPNSK